MAIPKLVNAQRDFSAGQLDPWVKRGDDTPIFKAGVRQAVNWRLLNSRGVTNRPGRSALFFDGPRTDKVRMAPNDDFYLVFGQNYVRVYNEVGTKVFDSGAVMLWTSANVNLVVWDVYQFSIYITFPGMRPKVLTWDGLGQGSAWVIADYVEQLIGLQKRTIFYRLSPLGVTMLPSARAGAITMVFSAGMNLTPAHVGTRMRFVNKQILITGVTDPTHANGIVQETLYAGFGLNSGTGQDLTQYFGIGDVVVGQLSGARGIVTGFSGVGNINVLVQGLASTSFGAVGNEVVVGPNGSVGITIVTGGNPFATAVWDDEVINAFRGYPASVAVDQGRLILCDFAAAPNLLAWSAITNFTDLYTDDVNAAPANAIVEIVPGKSRVLYVVPGMESAEFVFCDNAIYYIPINATNPLRPGSVAFNQISSAGAAQVKPRNAEQCIIYGVPGGNMVRAILVPGATNRPYIADDLSSLYLELIRTPVAIAVLTESEQFEENYIFVLNDDGTMAVGKFAIKGGVIDGNVGWVPWSGDATLTWIASFGADIIFTGTYAPGGVTPVSVVERLDASLYLDAAVMVNALPAALAPPVGLGPLWWIAGGTVNLMDQATRDMGTYQIDAQGYIIPQFLAGEDLTRLDLVAGQDWTATLEPFVPAAQAGQDLGQRMLRRRVSRAMTYVVNSTGFLWARLFPGPLYAGSPALGTVMNYYREPAYNQGDVSTDPPPLREGAFPYRPIGRAYDPRVALIKDTPGPITVEELGMEVTV